MVSVLFELAKVIFTLGKMKQKKYFIPPWLVQYYYHAIFNDNIRRRKVCVCVCLCEFQESFCFKDIFFLSRHQFRKRKSLKVSLWICCRIPKISRQLFIVQKKIIRDISIVSHKNGVVFSSHNSTFSSQTLPLFLIKCATRC